MFTSGFSSEKGHLAHRFYTTETLVLLYPYSLIFQTTYAEPLCPGAVHDNCIGAFS
jgi:hypothetical protein